MTLLAWRNNVTERNEKDGQWNVWIEDVKHAHMNHIKELYKRYLNGVIPQKEVSLFSRKSRISYKKTIDRQAIVHLFLSSCAYRSCAYR